MPKLRVTLEMSVPRLKDMTRARLRDYIKEAVESWGGQFFPGYTDDDHEEPADPLFYGCKSVKVGKIEILPSKKGA